jgi:mRNA interferase MazF
MHPERVRHSRGVRPAIVVSSDGLNEGRSGVIMVVPLTTTRRDLASHIEIESGESGLEVTSYAKCEDLNSVSVEHIVHRQGVAGPEVLFNIGRVLKFLLDL